MAQVEKLLVFLASPGDVSKERRIAEEVIAELNRTVAPGKNAVLQAVRWENDAFPGYGDDAQSLINAQIAEMKKYALFVGIMWNRLGTPTPRAESGTVEEFARAVESFTQNGQPNIWFYFRQSASNLNTEDQLEQRKKVLAFKKLVETNGMPWTYKHPSDFREKFRSQITLWLSARAQTGDNKDVVSKGGLSQVGNNKPEYFCYISRYKIDQLYSTLSAETAPEELSSNGLREIREILEKNISYGRTDIIQLQGALKRSYVHKLRIVLSAYSDEISQFEWSRKNADDKTGFFLIKAPFQVAKIDEKQLMAKLVAQKDESSLILHCSLKYFSEESVRDEKPFFHSTNYAFFHDELSVIFEAVFYLISIKDNEFYGSPLYLKLAPISGLIL